MNLPTKQIMVKAPLKQEWEIAVSEGIILREQKDNTQWGLGEWAENNCQKFGGKSLKELSIAIGSPYNSLREYRRVYLRIPPEDRIPHLSYRHHQKAADTNNPKEWLEKASDNEWTSEMLDLQINKSKGKVKEENINKPRIDVCDECGKLEIVGVDKKELCKCSCYKYRLKIPS